MSNYTNIDRSEIKFDIITTEKINFFDKNNWGPQLWNIMHLFSYNYDNNPDYITKQNAFNFFTSICLLLPCDYCKNHCYSYIQDNPPKVETKDELINWVLSFHNSVNRRSHKQTWTRQQLDSKYDTGDAFCQ